MFESVGRTAAELEALLVALARVGSDESSDGDRIDVLSALERVKAGVAAAQVRVTAAFVASQEQVARAWADRAGDCADAGDFEGWRAAREQERRATVTVEEPRVQNHSSGRRWRRPGSELGVGGQVALARRLSPVQGSAAVGVALALTSDMPHTLAALERGVISEWRAQILVRETSTLTGERRRLVDAQIVGGGCDGDVDTDSASDAGTDVAAGVSVDESVGRFGDRELARRVQAVAYRVDAQSVLARCRKAEAERRVSIRPAPDTMAYVTALLPVAQGVAVHAALTQAAATARAGGDVRGKGQVMADTFVTRLTGQEHADAVPVEVQVIITDRALLQGDGTPALVPGYGTVPAGWATDLLTRNLPDRDLTDRDLPVRDLPAGDGTPAHVPGYGTVPAGWATDLLTRDLTDRDLTDRELPARDLPASYLPDRDVPARDLPARDVPARDVSGDDSGVVSEPARVWVRRLFTHPTSGSLVGMDSGRRLFDGGLRRFVVARDGTCRTPWCDAPIRHIDHIRDHADGGPTTAQNGQGLCVRCNHAKQLPGWRARPVGPGERVGPELSVVGEVELAVVGDLHRRHTVVLMTPTGHTYQSTAPPVLPGLSEPDVDAGGELGDDWGDERDDAGSTISVLERYLERFLGGAA